MSSFSFTLPKRLPLHKILRPSQARAVAHQVRPFAASRFNSTKVPLADNDLVPMKGRFDLTAKNFIVTGGGRGIGYAAVRGIAEMGGNVAVVDAAPSPVADFNSLASEFGVKTKYVRSDVTDEAALTSAFAEVVSDFGSLDGCVTAAGVVPMGPFETHTWEETKRCFDINIAGTFFSVQLATKQMISQGTGGSIVLIASISGSVAAPGGKLSAYCASKGAIKMLNTALSVELAPSKIRVNAVSPGYIDTELLTPLKARQPNRMKMMEEEPPLKRVGNRNDLTPAIVYLLSDASPYTTGAEITVSGGIHGGRIETPYLSADEM